MFIDLETDRLLLKCIGYEDTDFFYKQFTTDEVNRYLYDAEPFSSVEEAKKWITFYLQPEPRDHHRWIMVQKETGEKIGTCGFHRWNRGTGEVEIGYDLQPAYWRKGYMTEALSAIIKYAADKMKVTKIYAHISVDNLASVCTVEKMGFKKTGKQYNEDFREVKYLHDIYCIDLASEQ